MSGVVPYLREGPASYQLLNSGVSITGGQLVMPDPVNPGGILTATAGSTLVLGVARDDAQFRTNQDGQNPANLAQFSPWIAVDYDVDIPVTYNAVCSLGMLLVAGPSGTVTPYTPALGGLVSGDQPAVPSSGTAFTNPYPYDASVVVTGGTVTQVLVNGTQEGTGDGTYTVPANDTITLVYSSAPTWAWTLSPAPATPSVPASNTVIQNTTGYNVQVVITGGTMTAVYVDGIAVGVGAGTYQLPAGGTIQLTYSVAPTWVWNVQASTFDMIVGKCTEPLGVLTAGATGRAWIGRP